MVAASAIGWTGWETIAIELITLMITLAGMVYGIGVALDSVKLKNFGSNEIAQGIINAAIIGAIVIIMGAITSMSSGFFPDKMCGSSNQSVDWLACKYSNLSQNLSVTEQELAHVTYITSYYQSMVLNFNHNGSTDIQSLMVQPLKGLGGSINTINTDMVTLNVIDTDIGLNVIIFSFISTMFMLFLFPFGLILRSFFMTRKLGGFLIALSLGLFIIYPLFILPFDSPQKDVSELNEALANFTSNSNYATIPLIDLNSNNAVAQRLDYISYNFDNGVDFIGGLTILCSELAHIISLLISYVFLAPLFSLLLTVVFIKETYDLFSGDFSVNQWIGWV